MPSRNATNIASYNIGLFYSSVFSLNLWQFAASIAFGQQLNLNKDWDLSNKYFKGTLKNISAL